MRSRLSLTYRQKRECAHCGAKDAASAAGVKTFWKPKSCARECNSKGGALWKGRHGKREVYFSEVDGKE